jgi:hypothetical protein
MIRTSQKVLSGGIILGSALSGIMFMIFKDDSTQSSADYFFIIGGSFLIGMLIGESFELLPIKKSIEIQFIHSQGSIQKNEEIPR